MTTKQHIIDMYLHLRSTNQSIPDEALEFMKRTCMEALDRETIEIPTEKMDFKKRDLRESFEQDIRDYLKMRNNDNTPKKD